MRSCKIFLTLLIAAAAVGLSACSDSADTSEASSSEQALEQTSSADEAKAETAADSSSADSSDEEKVYTMTITAEVTDYSDRQLTFLYEGESYTLPVKRENFKNDFPPLKWVKLYSEQILNNKLGKAVTAKLLVNNDITSILSCDIIGQNGYEFNGEGFKLTRTEGSMCELSKDGEIIEADLNDLVISEKCDYPKEIEGVSFSGYRFTDGGFIFTTKEQTE